jgi:type IV pilus assembly protein PilC
MGIFFRQVHALLKSGFPVAQACREAERHAPRGLRGLAREMATAAETGGQVSRVLAAHQDLLYPWHVGMVRAAEVAGFLPEAFDQIAHGYEQEWETRSALHLRLGVYLVLGLPAVLLTVPVILMLNHPIPEDGWTPTLVIATLLGYLRTVSLPILIGLVALFVVWQVLGSTAWFQGLQQSAVLRLPVAGRVARVAALERYLATLGLMLRAGVATGEAAEEAARAAGNASLTSRLMTVVEATRTGVPVSQALAATRLFDADTLNMATTGEISGALPDMLTRMASFYREENEGRRKMLLKMAGVVVGVVWLSGMGALVLFGIRSYFDFAFRVYDWMLQ